MINEVILSIALVICLHITEITDVSFQILGTSVCVSERIVVRACSHTAL